MKQQNKEFASFYAEFQRLALEGEVSEDSQITLLESALSRELKTQLTSVDAPDQNINQFAEFLQKLENKRRYYNDLSDHRPVRPAPGTPMARPTPTRTSAAAATTTTPATVDPDAMDLSSARRNQTGYQPSGRKERGECFRCGSAQHRVANCPVPPPANRPTQVRGNHFQGPENESRPVSPTFTEHSAKGRASI